MKVKSKSALLPLYLLNHPVAALLVDISNLRIVDANKSATSLLHFTNKKLQSLTIADLAASIKPKQLQCKPGKLSKLGPHLFNSRKEKVEVQVIAYSPATKSKHVVIELHNLVVIENHHFEKYLSSEKESIFVLAPDYTILAFNKLATQSIQKVFNKDVQLGDHMLDYAEPSTLELFKEHFNIALNGNEFINEIKVPFPNFDRWWAAKYVPIKTLSGTVTAVVFTAYDIHDRKVAEELLGSVRHQLKALTNNLPDAVVFQCLLNKNGVGYTFPYMSEGSWALFGIEAKDIMRDSSLGFSIVHPDDLSNMMALTSISQQNLTPYENTHRIIVNDKLKWVKTKSKPTKLDGFVLWDGVTIDVTSEIEEEQKASKLAQHYSGLLQSIDGIVWKAEKNTLHFTFVSDQVLTILGYTPEQWLDDDKFWEDNIIEEDRELVISFCKLEADNNRNHQIEYRMYHANGSIVWIHDQIWVNDSMMGGVMTDITTRKLDEEKLRKSEADLKAVLNASKDFTYVIDKNLIILLFNTAAHQSVKKFLGKELTIGQDIRDYADVGNSTLFLQRIASAFDGEVIEAELEMKIENHPSHWISILYNPVRDVAGKVIAVSLNLKDITVKKQAQEKLKTSEGNLRAVFDNSDIGFVLFSKDLKVVSWNTIANKFAMKFLDKAIEKDNSASDYFSAERESVLRPYFNKALNGQASDYEVSYQNENKPTHFLNKLFPAQDELGEVYGVVLALTDVTEIKEGQIDTVRSQKLYESLVKSQSSFLIRYDMEGYYTFANTSFLHHFDFDEKDILGKHSFETVHPEDWTICKNAEEECLVCPGKVVKSVFRKPNKKGDYFWTSWEFVAIQNKDGLVTDIQCLGYDMTATLTYQNELKATAKRLTAAKNSANMGVWELNLKTEQVVWDEQMYKVFGKKENGQLSFFDFADTVLPDDLPALQEQMGIAIKNNSQFETSFRIKRPSDQAIRHLQAYGMFDKEANTFTGVNFDITDRIEKEQAIIKATKQIEQLQLLALRSAMNPHFIFNALNSIQFFIAQNQRENAIEYLSKFSKLIRGILDNTANKKSTITSELELIKVYVEIEQLRFENKFDFELIVESSIDLDAIELPALLLQPFVENAILHGLYTKTERGLLSITVSESEQSFTIEIKDNGIGRAAASALRKANFPSHKSRGMRITEERVEYLNLKAPIKITVLDLVENNIPAGTQVNITIGKE